MKAHCPLILRYYRLMDVFAKSDDERDFYFDKLEGFLAFVDLDKETDDLAALEKELHGNKDRYYLVPKMTFFEIKKFMEGFVHEKVYDIDTKEKLLDLISAREARENFLEFIYDHLNELEKWQIYYQERSRIRIIEWLRSHNISFVFEEDLDLPRSMIEKLKKSLFDEKVSKEIAQAREAVLVKAKNYYSNEALNPRPKRGRPPKQAAKVEIEPQFTMDVYINVPKCVRFFLYLLDISSATSVTFSARFENEEKLLANLRGTTKIKVDDKLEALSQRLESLQNISKRLAVEDLGIGDRFKKALLPAEKPKLPEAKKIVGEEGGKIESAMLEALPARKQAEEIRRKKQFAIKKVAQIKSKEKK